MYLCVNDSMKIGLRMNGHFEYCSNEQPSSLVEVVVKLKDLTMVCHLAVPLVQMSGPTWAPSQLILRWHLVRQQWHVLNADVWVQQVLTEFSFYPRCI